MTEVIEIAVKAVRLYAETHPRPPHVTQKQAAVMLGMSAPTIAKMVRAGTFKLNACGLIPIEQIDAAISVRDQ
jgi:hypothetical protein